MSDTETTVDATRYADARLIVYGDEIREFTGRDPQPSPDRIYGFDPGTLSGADGHDWIERCLAAGWSVPPSWGLMGWDLGEWPLEVVAIAPDRRAFMVRIEGDIDLRAYETHEACEAAIDAWALEFWRTNPNSDDPDLEHTPPEHLRGPFSWGRLDDHEEAHAADLANPTQEGDTP